MNRNDVVEKIIDRCCQIFNKKSEDLTVNTNFIVDLNAKSGNISQITSCLEDIYDIEIPFMEFKRKQTIGEAADFIINLIEES